MDTKHCVVRVIEEKINYGGEGYIIDDVPLANSGKHAKA
jgi:hypothetical protein